MVVAIVVAVKVPNTLRRLPALDHIVKELIFLNDERAILTKASSH